MSADAKERPILFSGPMVRAILSGQKTQTRRAVRPQPLHGVGCYTEDGTPGEVDWVILDEDGDPTDSALRCPYGAPGDRLWVRETYFADPHKEPWRVPEDVAYKADYADGLEPRRLKSHGGWKPSIFMPRWACRLELEVVSVRVERLQEITALDAINEVGPGPVERFVWLWDSLNAKRGFGWDANPWVWRIEFRRAQ